jgi:hypothetical protein
MDNPEKLATYGTQDKDNAEKLATYGTQDKDNPEKLATYGTQDKDKKKQIKIVSDNLCHIMLYRVHFSGGRR